MATRDPGQEPDPDATRVRVLRRHRRPPGRVDQPGHQIVQRGRVTDLCTASTSGARAVIAAANAASLSW